MALECSQRFVETKELKLFSRNYDLFNVLVCCMSVYLDEVSSIRYTKKLNMRVGWAEKVDAICAHANNPSILFLATFNVKTETSSFWLFDMDKDIAHGKLIFQLVDLPLSI